MRYGAPEVTTLRGQKLIIIVHLYREYASVLQTASMRRVQIRIHEGSDERLAHT